jgi:hypothetical protein
MTENSGNSAFGSTSERPYTCSGDISNQTLKKLEVTATCFGDNVTVDGGGVVNPGATLQLTNSTVRGGITVNGGRLILPTAANHGRNDIDGLGGEYDHEVIDHAVGYVRGAVHTNGIENFWSLLKRTIKGTYVSVEPFHLGRYLDAQAFRFNARENNDSGRFLAVLSSVFEKRLTYRELTGNERSAIPS